MLGNDIIDIRAVLRSGQAMRPGFRQRICWDTEIKPLQTQFSEEYCTWILWAIKESAYKYYIQAGGPAMFAPKKFRFSVTKMGLDLISGETQTPLGTVASEVCLFNDYVIAESSLIASSFSDIHRLTYLLDAPRQNSKSKQLKQLISTDLAEKLALSPREISIQKDHRQVPFLYYKQQRLPYFISLSHHGAWGLFSYRKEN